MEVPPTGYAAGGLVIISIQLILVTESVLRTRWAIPFSHRCRRRLPSLPFNKASRRLRLSRRRGSRRRKLTVGGRASAPAILTRGDGVAGGSSSRGIEMDTVAPWRPDRDGVDAVPSAGLASDRVRFSSEAEACSVHVEMATVCWGDRVPWDRNLG